MRRTSICLQLTCVVHFYEDENEGMTMCNGLAHDEVKFTLEGVLEIFYS